MNPTNLTHQPTDTLSARHDHGRRRRWLVGGGLATATATAAAAVSIPLVLVPAMGVTELAQPAAAGGGPAAMCAEVTPEAIAGAGTSFRAHVERIEGDQVRLSVTDRYAGEVKNTVTTTQGVSQGVDGEPLTFVAGQTYLLSAREGMIITCGVSGVDSRELAALYTQAFNR